MVESRRVRPVVLRGIGLMTVALLLAGCADIRGTVPDAVIVPWDDCGDSGAAGRIPPDFEPVSVVLCDDVGTVADADGMWAGPATRHLEGDLAPLIAALGRPDDPRWPGGCLAIELIVPQLWLVNAAGRAVHVTYPVDGCGQPKADEVDKALALLTVTSSSVERLRLTESKAAVEAGCSTRWTPFRVVGPNELKDIPGLDAHRLIPPSGTEKNSTIPMAPLGLPPAERLDGMRLCHYISDASELPADTGSMVGLPLLGTFTGSSVLDADDGRIVLAAADYEVMPAIECIRPAAAFVVAHPLVDGEVPGNAITIELDTCGRLFGMSGFTFASDEVLALVRP